VQGHTPCGEVHRLSETSQNDIPESTRFGVRAVARHGRRVMEDTRAISDIKIGNRARKDMGDIAGLAASIDTLGLLHPVVISKTDELIAGERRIRAFELLGWTKIPVTVVDLAEIVRGEHAENEQRKDFTLSEAVAIKRRSSPPSPPPRRRARRLAPTSIASLLPM
jgi:hypothetical protein